MAFSKEPVKTPVSVYNIRITLTDNDATSGFPSSKNFQVDIKFNNGSIETRSGDLTPHLSAAQLTQLNSFLTAMRAKATAEFLP